MTKYRVEEGMQSPKDNDEIGYRHWDEFDNIEAARKCAKEIGLSRILKVNIVEEYKQGRKIKLANMP